MIIKLNNYDRYYISDDDIIEIPYYTGIFNIDLFIDMYANEYIDIYLFNEYNCFIIDRNYNKLVIDTYNKDLILFNDKFICLDTINLYKFLFRINNYYRYNIFIDISYFI